MKRVLIIAADFAPSSLPPALRARFFARELPAFGWEPIVLTVDPSCYSAPVDHEMRALLPESLDVIRTAALSERITRRLGIGDIGLRSLWHHWRTMRDLVRRERIDAVLISVPPYASMLLGRAAHRLGVPYVIDYIDPWRTAPYWRLPPDRRPPKWPLAYALARLIEPGVVRRAAHLTAVSAGTLDLVRAHYPSIDVDTTEIPYGGDAGDFAYLRAHPRRHGVFDPGDGFVHVSYVGACIPAMADTLRAVFEGLRRLKDDAPNVASRLRLHFVGTTYAPGGVDRSVVMPLARAAAVDGLVDERQARVSYLDALQIMLDSAGLLVVGSDAPHYTASKIFPCILARRPLLAVFHEESSVVAILRETSAGTVASFGAAGPQHAAPMVRDWLATVTNGTPPPATHWDRFEQYTTRAMAQRLARVFDRISRAPAVAAGAHAAV